MSRYDEDPRTPAVQVGKPQGGPLGDNWVPARDGRQEIMPREPAGLQTWAPPPMATVDPVWTPAETVSEVGTPVHRALATLVRAAPLVILLFPATLALVWLLEVSGWWILPLWAGLGIAGYLAVVWFDLVHNSPASTERHRINKAAQLKGLELRQAHELRRAIVEAYLRHLDGKGGGHA